MAVLVALPGLRAEPENAAGPETTVALEPAPAAKGAGTVDVRCNLETLGSLMKVIRAEEAELNQLQAQRKATKNEAVQKELDGQIQASQKQIEELRGNFRKVAAGVSEEDATFSLSPASLQKKIERLLQPLFIEVEKATADSRRLEEMKVEKNDWAGRKGVADEALSRIDSLLAANPEKAIADELRNVRRQWELHLAKASSEIKVLDVQIAEIEKHRRPVLETISSASTRFWRSRGLNLFLSIAAFLVTLMGGGWIYQKIRVVRDRKRGGRPSHWARVADVSASILTALLAFVAALAVLYAKGDWVLLSLAAIFIVGLVWAARNTFMSMIDQLRLLLNLGPVREGERLIFDGLPWRLDKLAFFSEFSNPELEGGVLRLPVRLLAGFHSRPYDPKEPWFPTRIGDWVVMDDSTFGRVVHQSPEQVVVLKLGGARKTYPTAAFLEGKPMNLSRGFRCRLQFGIDYRHQSAATADVPETLKNKVMEGLVAEIGHEAIESVKVEFLQAGDSSLDYEVIVDFTGEMASRHNKLRRLMARLCVEACNEHGWVIPFPQLVVHSAEESRKHGNPSKIAVKR
jgi:hypothetical protein